MVHIMLFLIIGIAFVLDASKAIIPNVLTMLGTLMGVVYHGATEGWSGIGYAVTGSLTGFMAMLLLYLLGALGAGDVKLFAAIGAMMGTGFVLQTGVYAICCAGVIGAILLIVRRKVRATSARLGGWLFTFIALRRIEGLFELQKQPNLKFPFMYAVVPGVAMAWYYSFV